VAIAKRLNLASVDELPNVPDSDGVWDLVGGYLGTFCANLTLITCTSKIIIGGGLINRGVLMESIRKHFV